MTPILCYTVFRTTEGRWYWNVFEVKYPPGKPPKEWGVAISMCSYPDLGAAKIMCESWLADNDYEATWIEPILKENDNEAFASSDRGNVHRQGFRRAN